MRKGIAFFFVGVVLLAWRGGPGAAGLLARYHQADSLFHLDRSTPRTDSLALTGFSSIVDELEKAGAGSGDTIFTGALLRTGILLDASGDYSRARGTYCRVLGFLPPTDSLAFVTQVYVADPLIQIVHPRPIRVTVIMEGGNGK